MVRLGHTGRGGGLLPSGQMTHAFADTAVRGPWFDGDYRLRRRVAPTVYTVRWLGLAISGLFVAALGGLIVTPALSSSAAVASTTTETPVAVAQPFELVCGPTHVGNQSKFTAS